jgi:hypothetical protein
MDSGEAGGVKAEALASCPAAHPWLAQASEIAFSLRPPLPVIPTVPGAPPEPGQGKTPVSIGPTLAADAPGGCGGVCDGHRWRGRA